jgi:uncharacterized repeat protein (TIGR03943 family)
VRRETQNILLVLLGGALLKIALNGTYLNYVKPALQPWLILSGGTMVVLAGVAIVTDIVKARRAPAADPAPATTDPALAGTTPLSAGTTPVSTGTTPLSAGTTPPLAGATPLSAGTAPLSAGAAPLSADISPLPAGAASLSAGTTPPLAGTAPASFDPAPVETASAKASPGPVLAAAIADHDHPHDALAATGPHSHDDGHGHSHGAARSAWMLLMPVLAIFLIAPPALGADSVNRAGGRTVASEQRQDQVIKTKFPPLPAGAVVPMRMADVATRAAWDSTNSLNGRTLELTGFVVHDPSGVYLARLVITCCAADAMPVKARLVGTEGLVDDEWITVTGKVRPDSAVQADNYVPEFDVATVKKIPTPSDPYEY